MGEGALVLRALLSAFVSAKTKHSKNNRALLRMIDFFTSVSYLPQAACGGLRLSVPVGKRRRDASGKRSDTGL